MKKTTITIGADHNIDPNIEPSDYFGWGVYGKHVTIRDTVGVSAEYLAKLALELLTAGAAGLSYE